jgi:hypothetical protein
VPLSPPPPAPPQPPFPTSLALVEKFGQVNVNMLRGGKRDPPARPDGEPSAAAAAAAAGAGSSRALVHVGVADAGLSAGEVLAHPSASSGPLVHLRVLHLVGMGLVVADVRGLAALEELDLQNNSLTVRVRVRVGWGGVGWGADVPGGCGDTGRRGGCCGGGGAWAVGWQVQPQLTLVRT